MTFISGNSITFHVLALFALSLFFCSMNVNNPTNSTYTEYRTTSPSSPIFLASPLSQSQTDLIAPEPSFLIQSIFLNPDHRIWVWINVPNNPPENRIIVPITQEPALLSTQPVPNNYVIFQPMDTLVEPSNQPTFQTHIQPR